MLEELLVRVPIPVSQDLTQTAAPPLKQHCWPPITTLCPRSLEWNLSSPWNAWDVQKEPSNMVPPTICPGHRGEAHGVEMCTGRAQGPAFVCSFLCTEQLGRFILKSTSDAGEGKFSQVSWRPSSARREEEDPLVERIQQAHHS